MLNIGTIPNHWQLKKLGEVCQFIGGGTPSKKVISYWKGNIPWASIKDIKGTFLTKTTDSISEEGVKNSATNIASPGELIIATRINPGRVILSKIKTAINQDLKIARPKLHTDVSFLLYLFQNLERNIIKVSSGTTVLGINLNLLNEIKIPIPPFPEQQAIVSKIEELFSELDNGIAQLKTAQQQLKVYRQSLLKWAFEGKLTNKHLKEGELPKGWKNVELKGIVERISDGPFGSNLKSIDYVNEGVRVIRLENIGEMEFRNEYKTFVTQEKYETIKRYTVGKGDIIFSSFISESIRSVILPDYIESAINKADCFLVRVSEATVSKKYLAYYFSTKAMQNQLVNQIHGATRPRINTTQLKASKIPFAPLKEQQLIVSELESKLTVCDKIEETISQSLQQAETLRQSILKKAFEGKLVKMKQ